MMKFMSIPHIILLVYLIIAAIVGVVTLFMILKAEIEDHKAGIINYDKKFFPILSYYMSILLATILIAAIWPAIIIFMVKPDKRDKL